MAKCKVSILFDNDQMRMNLSPEEFDALWRLIHFGSIDDIGLKHINKLVYKFDFVKKFYIDYEDQSQ